MSISTALTCRRKREQYAQLWRFDQMSSDQVFDKRKAHVKRAYISLNLLSALCVLALIFWIFVRLFFCWEDSCGLWCWFCGLHWVITGLLIFCLITFFFMSFALLMISEEHETEPPETIENPWVPGVKTAVKSFHAMSRAQQRLSTKLANVPGASRASRLTQKISSATKAIPGVNPLMIRAYRSTRMMHDKIRRMEHGRTILGRESAPAIWTFFFTALSLAVALFLILGPFKHVFLP